MITMNTKRFTLVLVAILVGSVSLPALAKRVHGPCVWRDGVCERSVDYVFANPEEAFNLTPAKRSAALQQAVRYSVASGKIERYAIPEALTPASLSSDSSDIQSLSGDGNELSFKMEKPWLHDFGRTIVKLSIKFPYQHGTGWYTTCSGVMVGYHTVLTAAHCVFTHPDPDEGETFDPQYASTVEVYPAASGESSHGINTPFGKANGTDFVATSAWTDYHDHGGDWAMVKIDRDSASLTGWPATNWGGSWSGIINYAGYPGHEYSGLEQYYGSGSMGSSNEFLICHDGYVVGGMSGGPSYLYWADTDTRKVVGVNSHKYPGLGISCTARFTAESDQLRDQFEAEDVSGNLDNWGCSLANYMADDGCHCGCNVWDPDCDQDKESPIGCSLPNSYCAMDAGCGCDADTCSSLSRECGLANDGCGGSVDCGGCNAHANSFCNSSGQCECTPSTCDSLGLECGPASDGCGGSLNCGGCSQFANSYCSSAGHCECQPETCNSIGIECGEAADGCGGTLTCGGCSGFANSFCDADGQCNCQPDSCQSIGIECGEVADGCGITLECGECAPEVEDDEPNRDPHGAPSRPEQGNDGPPEHGPEWAPDLGDEADMDAGSGAGCTAGRRVSTTAPPMLICLLLMALAFVRFATRSRSQHC